MKLYAVKETRVLDFVIATIDSEHGHFEVACNMADDITEYEGAKLTFEGKYKQLDKIWGCKSNIFDLDYWMTDQVEGHYLVHTIGPELGDELAELAEVHMFLASIIHYLHVFTI